MQGRENHREVILQIDLANHTTFDGVWRFLADNPKETAPMPDGKWCKRLEYWASHGRAPKSGDDARSSAICGWRLTSTIQISLSKTTSVATSPAISSNLQR